MPRTYTRLLESRRPWRFINTHPQKKNDIGKAGQPNTKICREQMSTAVPEEELCGQWKTRGCGQFHPFFPNRKRPKSACFPWRPTKTEGLKFFVFLEKKVSPLFNFGEVLEPISLDLRRNHSDRNLLRQSHAHHMHTPHHNQHFQPKILSQTPQRRNLTTQAVYMYGLTLHFQMTFKRNRKTNTFSSLLFLANRNLLPKRVTQCSKRGAQLALFSETSGIGNWDESMEHCQLGPICSETERKNGKRDPTSENTRFWRHTLFHTHFTRH